MSTQISSGTRAAIMAALAATFEHGVARGYSGSLPSNPDDPENGDMLVEFSLDGVSFTPGVSADGLNFDSPEHDAGFTMTLIAKPGSATWKGSAVKAGTIGYIRLYANDRTTGLSHLAERIDGLASTAEGSPFVVSTVTTKVGVEVTLSECNLFISYRMAT